MKNRLFAINIHKLSKIAIGILLLPIFAACAANETAQVPEQTTPPVADVVTPEAVPTVPATTPVTPGVATNEDITEVVKTNPSLSTLASLIDEANLEDQLKKGSYTIFAPSNQAFAALPQATRQRLLQPENRALLRQVLTNHVVAGNLTSNQIQSQQVNTLDNTPVNIQTDPTTQEVRVNDARVIQPDIRASNGVVHIVDRVILPPNI